MAPEAAVASVVERAARPRPEGARCVDVAMLGARLHYAVPRLLQEAGLLGRFFTDFYSGSKPRATRILSALPGPVRPGFVDRLLGRADPGLDPDRVVSFDVFGAAYACQAWWTQDPDARNALYARAARAFTRRIIRHGVDRAHADAIYALNGAALELFAHARDRGVRCVLEQTIVPARVVRTVLSEERERWPGWEPTAAHEPAEDPIEARERGEWSSADVVVGGSPVVIEALRRAGVPDAKCRVVRYGVPLERFRPTARSVRPATKPLRVLFVGGVELRKGVPYLLEALHLLGGARVDARLAGPLRVPTKRLARYHEVARFIGAVPRHQIEVLYGWADILVLPSLCEGSALVTYEALAWGLPVVVTPESGAWVRDGADGLVVPARDPEGLAAALDRFARDRDFLSHCGKEAVAGRERLGLDAYQRRLTDLLGDLPPLAEHGVDRGRA